MPYAHRPRTWARRLLASAAVPLLGLAVAAPAAHAASSRAAAAGGPPVVVAHRNGAAYAPENTLAAVRAAALLGAGWLETDVQRTKDHRLVLMHDPTLRRTTNVESRYPGHKPWRVGDLTLRQTERLDAGGWFAPRFRGERVPTLRRYLRMLDRTGQGVLLEIKSPELYPGMVRQIAGELRRDGWLDGAHRDRLVVQSFDAGAVRAFHELEPKVTTAVIGAPRGRELAADARFADVISPKFTHVTKKYAAAVHRTRAAHGHRMRLYVWTIDDRATARRVTRDGADGIISDKPDLRP